MSVRTGVAPAPEAESTSQPEPASRVARRASRLGARRRWWHEWPLVLVLLTAAAGLAIVASDHFKRGTGLFGIAIALATVLRAVLPDDRAGLLQVRSKRVDVATLAALAAATLTLVVVVPPPTA